MAMLGKDNSWSAAGAAVKAEGAHGHPGAKEQKEKAQED